MNTAEKNEIRGNFYEQVNMSPSELKNWLDTEESKNVGQKKADDESVGHKSGERIIAIKKKNKDEYVEDDYKHMQKVVGYIKRHLAQKPQNNIESSKWRYSLMNWGHDPCKNIDC